MLEDVKLAIGIATDAYDKDLKGLIDACKIDLHIHGVDKSKIIETDALTHQAIIFYCKAYFRNSDKAQRYRGAYEALRTAMSMAGEYRCKT